MMNGGDDNGHGNRQTNYHLGHFLKEILLQDPDAICQIDAATGQEETRRSVLTRAIQLAQRLRALGLEPGDVLALGGTNHLDLCIPHFAGLLNGYPVAGVDPFPTYDEIKYLFKLVEPRIAFCQSESLAHYRRAADELGLDTRIVVFDGTEQTMADLVQDCDAGSLEDIEVADFDAEKVFAWLVSTSGSTGLPKVAALSHQAVLALLLDLKTYAEPKLSKALNLSGMQWVSGYIAALNVTASNFVRVQTSAPASTEHVIDIINQYRPTRITGAPIYFTLILKHQLPCDLTCFDCVVLSGANIHKSFLADLKAALRPDAVVVEVYGQTETLGLVLRPAPQGPLGNCGQETPFIQVKLVDPATGEAVTEPNMPGELWVKGGRRFTEYYKNPEETAKVLTPDGWYKSGDLLRRDEDGYYFFVERLKMLIKYRSYNVIPKELEELILTHDGIQDVCVTSIASVVDRELPVAVVVRGAGARVGAREIKELVAENLSAYKQLRCGVLFVDQLPMTSSGKIARAKVRQLVDGAPLE